MPETVAFALLWGVILGSYLLFVLRIVYQLTTFLGVNFFTIKPKSS
jgi:hypothetical protein